jgi:hypothetical protein
MSWPTGYQPFGPNRHPLLTGLNATTGLGAIPVAVDPATGAIIVMGGLNYSQGANSYDYVLGLNNLTSTVTIDTTQSQTFNSTAAWSASHSGNSLTTMECSLEVLN